MEKPVTVTILGHEYRIKSDEDEERVRYIAQFVNDKFEAIIDSTDGLSERKTAILVAFDIASDYFQVLKERDGVAVDIQGRSRALNVQIDSVMR
ncbi:MAG: cell division protein ZapA [Deltaproteobacteria bacterium]|nr:cell division protein ZapA [Deltaproteobacteria bacterium]MBW2034887.1 cell division protein ZapA [Deltaproteobacteria bacterium]MBW2118285.1 cell division protein ZapA [Deltaproteobacteria bacterium]MBW2343625.1 cell division protein ZapA [Deltaproteobacteria bacterium]